jgi:hypothetical protein
MRFAARVRFDIVWRGTGGDTVLATVTHDFEPHGDGSLNAILFETDLQGIAAPAVPGDQLVLRFTTVSGPTGAYYIPNGDGALVNGRTVNLTLP